MTQTDKLIAKSHYGELVRQARVQREAPLLEAPDQKRLRVLAEKIRLLVAEAKQTPGAALVWGHLSDALDAAIAKVLEATP